MTTQEINISNLTSGQLKTFKSLVRLGDSVELAIKTVLEQKEKGKEIYEAAYHN